MYMKPTTVNTISVSLKIHTNTNKNHRDFGIFKQINIQTFREKRMNSKKPKSFQYS